MAQTSGLTVRQFERQEINLSIELVVADEHRQQVSFSGSSGLSNPGVITGTSVDFSSGGAGLETPKLVPRGMRGVLRVLVADSNPPGPDGAPVTTQLIEQAVKVRRSTLLSHEPTYFVGVSFIDQGDDFDSKLATLLQHIRDLKDNEESNDEASSHA